MVKIIPSAPDQLGKALETVDEQKKMIEDLNKRVAELEVLLSDYGTSSRSAETRRRRSRRQPPKNTQHQEATTSPKVNKGRNNINNSIPSDHQGTPTGANTLEQNPEGLPDPISQRAGSSTAGYLPPDPSYPMGTTNDELDPQREQSVQVITQVTTGPMPVSLTWSPHSPSPRQPPQAASLTNPMRIYDDWAVNRAISPVPEVRIPCGFTNRLLTRSLKLVQGAIYEAAHRALPDLAARWFPESPFEVPLSRGEINECGLWALGSVRGDGFPGRYSGMYHCALARIPELRNAVCHFGHASLVLKPSDSDRLIQYAQEIAVALGDTTRSRQLRGVRDELRKGVDRAEKEIGNLAGLAVLPFGKEWTLEPHHLRFLPNCYQGGWERRLEYAGVRAVAAAYLHDQMTGNQPIFISPFQPTAYR